jgi:hypothetical protein
VLPARGERVPRLKFSIRSLLCQAGRCGRGVPHRGCSWTQHFLAEKIAIKRLSIAVLTTALVLGLSVPASAADPHASCSGLVASSVAGQSGARAEIQRDVFQTAIEDGITPGAVSSEFSHFHEGSAEVCLG